MKNLILLRYWRVQNDHSNTIYYADKRYYPDREVAITRTGAMVQAKDMKVWRAEIYEARLIDGFIMGEDGVVHKITI